MLTVLGAGTGRLGCPSLHAWGRWQQVPPMRLTRTLQLGCVQPLLITEVIYTGAGAGLDSKSSASSCSMTSTSTVDPSCNRDHNEAGVRLGARITRRVA